MAKISKRYKEWVKDQKSITPSKELVKEEEEEESIHIPQPELISKQTPKFLPRLEDLQKEISFKHSEDIEKDIQ